MALLLGPGCEGEPGQETLPERSTAQALGSSGGSAGSISATPTLCNPPAFSSSEKKPPGTKACSKITIELPSLAYRVKQQAYLAELSVRRVQWSGMSASWQQAQQALLKKTYLGSGGGAP